LVAAGVPTGINCVVGCRNFDAIPNLFRYAKEKGTNEIEFLRLKPVGRAGPVYEEQKTTFAQNVALARMLGELSEQDGITAKIDCSFIPMLCYHDPPHDMLEKLGTYGCEAANVLLGVRSDGTVSGCSFLPGTGPSVFELRDRWETDEVFQSLRTWIDRAPEPCRSCSYLDICKGGCHAVAYYVSGDLFAPDPDCPWVVERERQREGRGA
jgi:radical SAM protein with 4Fe4S-binding SPASM domain